MEGLGNINWSSVGSIGTIVALVVISLTQILRDWIKSRKDSGDTLLVQEMCRSVDALYESVQTYRADDAALKKELLSVLKTISYQYDSNLPEKQADLIIRMKMDWLKHRIIYVVHSIIANNNVEEQAEDVRTKLFNSIDNLFDDTSQWLESFQHKSEHLGDLIESKWAKEISECLYGMVLKHRSYLAVIAYVDTKITHYTLIMLKNLKQESV